MAASRPGIVARPGDKTGSPTPDAAPELLFPAAKALKEATALPDPAVANRMGSQRRRSLALIICRQQVARSTQPGCRWKSEVRGNCLARSSSFRDRCEHTAPENLERRVRRTRSSRTTCNHLGVTSGRSPLGRETQAELTLPTAESRTQYSRTALKSTAT